MLNREVEKKIKDHDTQLEQIEQQDYFIESKRHYYSQIDYSIRNGSTINNENKSYNIVLMGDSLFGYLNIQLVEYLRNNYGINGLGFDKFGVYGNLGRSYGHLTTITQSNITIVQDSENNNDEWGFCGRVHKFGSTSTFSYTPDEYYTFNDFRIFYLKKVNGGQFQYRVDGGSWVTVDTNSASSQLGYIEVNDIVIPSGKFKFSTHTVEINGLSGESWLYGIQTFNLKTNGILLNLINEGGTLARQWSKNMKYVQGFLDVLNCNQLHIWLGTNDAGAEGRSANDFENDYLNILNNINLAIDRDIVLYTFTQRESFSTPNTVDDNYTKLIEQYISKIRNISKQRNLSIFNLYSVYPKWQDGKALSMYADQIHPSTKGANYISSLLVPYIVPNIYKNYANLDNKNFFKNDIGLKSGAYFGMAAVNSRGELVYPSTLGTGLTFNGGEIRYNINGNKKMRYGNGIGFEVTQNNSGEIILRVQSVTGQTFDFKYDTNIPAFVLDSGNTNYTLSKNGNNIVLLNGNLEVLTKLIVKSPDGSRWYLELNNDGTLKTTKL